jgi:glycosyltransferase involved in cell wall biosynthesis
VSKKLKILWASISPNLRSGYGWVTNEVCWPLRQHGYDVMLYGFHVKGEPHLMVTTEGRQFMMLGTEDLNYDYPLDVKLEKLMQKYGRDVLITLQDVWALPNPEKLGSKIPGWIPYFPLDSDMNSIHAQCLSSAFHRIAMSKFGQRECEKAHLESEMIYHGVRTKQFVPFPKEKRKEFRRSIGLPEDAFIAGTIGMNLWDRKRLDRMIWAFARFIEITKAKNAYLYMHCGASPADPNTGFRLDRIADEYGIGDKVKFPEQDSLVVPTSTMPALFNVFDVYLSTAGGEGFGLPIMEAQACGVPCIVAANSAQTELVEGHGWTVPCPDYVHAVVSPINPRWYLVDVEKFAQSIAEAYSDQDLLRRRGEESHEFAQQFSWEKIIKENWLPLMERVEAEVGEKKHTSRSDHSIWGVLKTMEEAKNYILSDYAHGKTGFVHCDFLNDPRVADKLKGCKKILDFGCGVGRNLKKLRELAPAASLYGYDFPNMIDLAMKFLGDFHLRRLGTDDEGPFWKDEIVLMDYQIPGPWDAVVATIVFQHIPEVELRGILKELATKLSKDGVLVMFGRGYLNDDHKNIWKIVTDYFETDDESFDQDDGTKNHQGAIFTPLGRMETRSGIS